MLSLDGAGDDLRTSSRRTFARSSATTAARSRAIGDVRIETPTPETLDELLTALFDLHAARWQTRATAGRPRRRRQRSASIATSRARMLDAGVLRMYATRVDDRIVAVFYGFAISGTVYYYLSGYDPELEKLQHRHAPRRPRHRRSGARRRDDVRFPPRRRGVQVRVGRDGPDESAAAAVQGG